MRRVFGGEIDRPLLPILAVTLSGSIAGGMLWTFVGVWAIKRLGRVRRPARVRVPRRRNAPPRSAATSAATSPTASAAGR
jgi:hypothetical protein